MTVPAATIAIPTFNAGPWIEAAVASALAQTYDDLEVIVLDDGSTDDTYERLARIRDPRFQYVRFEANGGFARNFGQAIARARGRHLVVPGADDVLMPDFLDKAVAALEAAPGAAMLHAGATWIDESGRQIGGFAGRWPETSSGADAFARCFTEGFCFPAIVFVTEHLKRLKRSIEEWQEIVDVWLFLHSCCAGDVLFLDEALVSYRVHSTSMSFGMYADGRMFRTHRQRALEAFDWPEARAMGLESRRDEALAGVARDAIATLHLYRLNQSAVSTLRYFSEITASAPGVLLEPGVWMRLGFSMLPRSAIQAMRARRHRRRLLAVEGR